MAIKATELFWQGSEMVQNSFLWTWDARPYPYWPNLNHIWADHALWKTGHWVQGKFGASGLAGIVTDLCKRAGLQLHQFDVSQIDDDVDGFVISHTMSIATAISLLQHAYFVDIFATEGVLRFIQYHKFKKQPIEINRRNVVLNKEGVSVVKMHQSTLSLPRTIHIHYLDKVRDYQPGHIYQSRTEHKHAQQHSITLPIVMAMRQAEMVASQMLHDTWQASIYYYVTIHYEGDHLYPGGVIELEDEENITAAAYSTITS